MKQQIILYAVVILWSAAGSGSDFTFNIKDYGAKGDGRTLETNALQQAIDAAYKNGGGKVVVPAGTYKIGTLVLKDNVQLHLSSGATLLGSDDIADYIAVEQKMESRARNLYARYFMIFAENARNISITGHGVIDGNGKNHFQVARPQNRRPFMVRLVGCNNVTIRDVQLLESANWTLHFLGCKDVLADNIRLYNSTHNGNRDGVDIDACENVTVTNCRIRSVDDAIVMKATNDRVCKNITITNCVLSSYASAIKTGTESNGGFKNISVSNCVIENIPVHAGIELMTVDGGDMENITFSNIVMNNVATPIFVYLGNRARPYKAGQYVQKVSRVRDIHFDNIVINGATLPSGVVGLTYKKVQNVSFSHITVRYNKALKEESLAVNAVPYKDFSYPMARMHGANLPAFAFYCRNAESLSFERIKIKAAAGEDRPAFVFDNTKNVNLNGVETTGTVKTTAPFYLRNSASVKATFCNASSAYDALVAVEEGNCEDIRTVDNFLAENQKDVTKVAAKPRENRFSRIKTSWQFTVDSANIIDGLPAQDIAQNPLRLRFSIPEEGTPQLILLVKSADSNKRRIKIQYNNTEQSFFLDWAQWGWAPITLSHPPEAGEEVSLLITAAETNQPLYISRAVIKKLVLGYTD